MVGVGDQGLRALGGHADDTLRSTAAGVLRGEDGADVLTGGDARDQLSGGPGPDVLASGGGDDVLFADGDDRIDGGPGTDLADFSETLRAIWLDFAAPGAPVAIEGLRGSQFAGHDLLTAPVLGAVVLDGGEGRDWLRPRHGPALGGPGRDVLDLSGARAGTGPSRCGPDSCARRINRPRAAPRHAHAL